jgi:hypothetical protein
MMQVILNISSKKKWNALKTILDLMNIDYITQGSIGKISEKETELLLLADNDKETGRVNAYTSHRDIIGR